MALQDDPMNRPARVSVPKSPGGYSAQAVKDAQFQLSGGAPYLGMNPPASMQQPPLTIPQQAQPMPTIAPPPQAQEQQMPQPMQQPSPVAFPRQGAIPMGLEGIAPGGKLPVGPGFNPMEPAEVESPRTVDYKSQIGNLQRTMNAVVSDNKLSPEQKQQAFDKINAAMKEMDEAYQAGYRTIPQLSPTYGMPEQRAAPEQFGAIRGGLTPVSGGLRNPETGDVMPAVPTETGEMLPAPKSQVQIDSLPAGTRYVDVEGKIQTVKGATGKAAGAAEEPSAGTAARGPATRQEISKQYTQWSKANDPGTTPEEIEYLQSVAATPGQQQTENVDPESMINSLTPEQRQEFGKARLRAFQRSYQEDRAREDELSRMFGLEEKEEPKRALDDRYVLEAGTRGTVRAVRRGSMLAGGIPVVQRQDGQYMAAPSGMAELADLERDTEFVNIRTSPDWGVDENGEPLQIRVTPFNKETIDTQDFVMTDSIRAAMINSGQIKPRPKAVWDSFTKDLSEYATVGENWSPETNQKHAALVQKVSNFYTELSPSGRYGMTLYIAQGLGYNVTKSGGKSMGFGGLENPQVAKAAEAAKNQAKYRFNPQLLGNAFAEQAKAMGGEGLARDAESILGGKDLSRFRTNYDETIKVIGANIAGHARLQAPGDYALGKPGNEQIERALSEEVVKSIPDEAAKQKLRDELARYFGWGAAAPQQAPAAPAAQQAQPAAARVQQPAAPQAAQQPVTTESQSFVPRQGRGDDVMRQLSALTRRADDARVERVQESVGRRGGEYLPIIDESVRRNQEAETQKLLGDYDPNKPRWQPKMGPPDPDELYRRSQEINRRGTSIPKEEVDRVMAEKAKTPAQKESSEIAKKQAADEQKVRREQRYREDLASREAKERSAEYSKKASDKANAEKAKAKEKSDREAAFRESQAAELRRLESEAEAKRRAPDIEQMNLREKRLESQAIQEEINRLERLKSSGPYRGSAAFDDRIASLKKKKKALDSQYKLDR